MKFMKKLTMLLSLFFIMTSISACQNKNEVNDTSSTQISDLSQENQNVDENSTKTNKEDKSSKKSNETRIITDHAGRQIELPKKIERIVIDQVPILSTYMAYNHGKAPGIVGYAGSLKKAISGTVLANMAPELMEATNTVEAQSDLNIEEIIKLNPDVIFYNAKNQDRYEILSKSGIPCVGFSTMGADTPADPIDRNNEWLKLLEQVFGEEGKMDDFIKDGDAIVKEVEEKIAKIPEEERPSSMILWKYEQAVPTVAGKGTFGDFWLKRLKVKNVAEDTKGYAQVNFEQITDWDPDVLVLDGPGLLDISTDDVINNNVEGADFSPLTSVSNKRVYNTKLGMWNWLTPNSDAPLILAWLAMSHYPEEFKDYPLKEKVKEYYQKWYDYNLTDEEIEDMFSI